MTNKSDFNGKTGIVLRGIGIGLLTLGLLLGGIFTVVSHVQYNKTKQQIEQQMDAFFADISRIAETPGKVVHSDSLFFTTIFEYYVEEDDAWHEYTCWDYIAAYPVGRETILYYDMDNPDNAICPEYMKDMTALRRSILRLIGAFLGVGTGGVGLVLLIVGVRVKRKAAHS